MPKHISTTLLALSLAIATGASCKPAEGLYEFKEDAISPIPKNTSTPEEQRRMRLEKAPAPATWAAGTTWRFTERDKQGNVAHTGNLCVTDKQVHSCMAGDWRQLEVVEGDLKQLRAPAYEQKGRVLTIILSNDMCDSYSMYVGEFVGDAFKGQSTWLGLGRSKDFGAVLGQQISSARN